MASASDPILKQFHADIYQALKVWSKGDSKKSSLHNLSLFHQFRHEGYSIHKATNKVILEALAELEKEKPKPAILLRKRFIGNESVHIVANYFNVSDSYVYNLQREAIGYLAETLQEMEQAAINARQEILETRLEFPTYSYLIGVEQHLSTLRQTVVESKRPWIVSIEGIGGIGKTSLADALLRQIISQGLFENFGWVSARQEMLNLGGGIKPIEQPALTVEGLVEELVMQLLGFTPAQLSGKQAFDALHHRLKEQPHLIVIDNLETMVDVESLLPTLRRFASPTKFLLTSRKSLYGKSGVYHFVLPPLSEANALRLIREEANVHHLPHLAEASDEDLLPIYETVGGNPLALRLLVGQTHMHPLHIILGDLKAARGEKVENLYTYIYRRAWDTLDQLTRMTFCQTPLALDQGSELDFLQAITGLELHDLRRALDLLVTLNLVDLKGKLGKRRYSIHNLTRTFLEEQVIKWQ